MNRIKAYFERQAFGVCEKLGQYLLISSTQIRLFFIYSSFIALGSPIIIYLSLAFIMNLRKYHRRRLKSVWYH